MKYLYQDYFSIFCLLLTLSLAMFSPPVCAERVEEGVVPSETETSQISTTQAPSPPVTTDPAVVLQQQQQMLQQQLFQQQMMQMILGGNNNNSNNNNMGLNPMMMMPYAQAQSYGQSMPDPATTPTPGWDPAVMSNLLRDQMLQNFSLENEK